MKFIEALEKASISARRCYLMCNMEQTQIIVSDGKIITYDSILKTKDMLSDSWDFLVPIDITYLLGSKITSIEGLEKENNNVIICCSNGDKIKMYPSNENYYSFIETTINDISSVLDSEITEIIESFKKNKLKIKIITKKGSLTFFWYVSDYDKIVTARIGR